MASHRVLPAILGNVSTRFATPAIASIVIGLILIAVTWVYLLASSIATAFIALIDVSGMLYASFYLLTALSAVVYYRRRIFSNAWDAVLVGILPVAATGFLVWIVVKSVQNAPAVAAVVADRRRRGWRDPDARRPFRPAFPVLPHPARERA